MLSPSEQTLVEETWALLASDLKQCGVDVFLRFFTDYPKYQQSFKSFAKVPLDELPGNKRFQAHAFTVTSAIDGLVGNLDDPEMLEEMLLKTGVNHARRKIPGEAFDEFEISFLKYLEISLGRKWSVEVETAWKLVSRTIISKIKQGLDGAADD